MADWTCPKGCSQQPCPHSAEATKDRYAKADDVVKSDSWLRYEQLEPEDR